MKNADSLVILDFETTGLSPDRGDRAIEIGAVRIENGVLTDRFQALMNPGFRITSFIEEYTGITNNMLSKAPPCKEVMSQFHEFIGDDNLVAHNASFDKRFLDAEFNNIRATYAGAFSCSLLLSRRLYPDAPNHKLGTLVSYKNIHSNGDFHRALFDSEMTAKLWLAMLEDVAIQTSCLNIPLSLITTLSKAPKAKTAQIINQFKSHN